MINNKSDKWVILISDKKCIIKFMQVEAMLEALRGVRDLGVRLGPVHVPDHHLGKSKFQISNCTCIRNICYIGIDFYNIYK